METPNVKIEGKLEKVKPPYFNSKRGFYVVCVKVLGQWKFPSYLPPKCKIVDCGGRPKPHDLGNLKYIKENWHDVE